MTTLASIACCIALASVPGQDAGAAGFPTPDAGAAESPKPKAPAITAESIDGILDYLEWLFDAPLNVAQRDEGKALLGRIESASTAEQGLLRELLASQADLANHSEADRAGLRSSVEDEFLKSLNRHHRNLALGKWLLTLEQHLRRPLVKGTPALTRHATDGLAELLAFCASQAGLPTTADQGFRDAFAQSLAGDFKRLAPEAKKAVAASPSSWANLRKAWAFLPSEKKNELLDKWRALLGPMSGGDAGVGLRADSPATRRAGATLAVEATSWL